MELKLDYKLYNSTKVFVIFSYKTAKDLALAAFWEKKSLGN